MMSFVKPLQLLHLQCVNCARNKLLVTSYHMTSHFSRRSFSSSSYLCEVSLISHTDRHQLLTAYRGACVCPEGCPGGGVSVSGGVSVHTHPHTPPGPRGRHPPPESEANTPWPGPLERQTLDLRESIYSDARRIITARNSSCGKVMFSQVCVNQEFFPQGGCVSQHAMG